MPNIKQGGSLWFLAPKVIWATLSLMLLLSSCFLVSSKAVAEQKPVTIIFAFVDINFNPYQSWQGEQVLGPDPDFIRAVLNKLPYQYDIVKLPILRTVAMLEKGQIHMTTMFPGAAKSSFAIFSKVPLHYANYRLATLKGSDFKFVDYSDLYGKNEIGVVYGNTIGKEFDQLVASGFIQPTRTKSYNNVIELLTRERVDAIAGNEFVIRYFAEKKGISQDIRFLERSLDENRPFSIAISKKSLGVSATKLAEQINNIMQAMVDSGELEKIYQKNQLDFAYYGRDG